MDVSLPNDSNILRKEAEKICKFYLLVIKNKSDIVVIGALVIFLSSSVIWPSYSTQLARNKSRR